MMIDIAVASQLVALMGRCFSHARQHIAAVAVINSVCIAVVRMQLDGWMGGEIEQTKFVVSWVRDVIANSVRDIAMAMAIVDGSGVCHYYHSGWLKRPRE